MPSPLAAGVHDVISTWLHPLRRNERSRALPLAFVAAGMTRVQSGMRALQPNCDAAVFEVSRVELMTNPHLNSPSCEARKFVHFLGNAFRRQA